MSAETQSGASATCPLHPAVAAHFVCGRCQTAVCVDCCYKMADGSVCCKTCYHAEPLSQSAAEPAAQPAPAVTPPPLPAASSSPWRVTINKASTPAAAYLPTRHLGVGCVQHPRVMAVANCENCGAPSCPTCDFVFPGKLHFCPVCIGEGTNKLSPRRKKYMIAAYALGVWSSLGLVALITGVAAGLADDAVGELIVGFGVILLIGLPAIIGTGLGMSAKRPGGPNPFPVWIALVWNALILGGFILLMILGNLSE